MNTEQREAVESHQRQTALRRLQEASEDVKRLADHIRRQMVELEGQIQDGLHARDMDHQRPFDLAAALERRKQAIHWACAVGCTSGDIVEASKGGRS